MSQGLERFSRRGGSDRVLGGGAGSAPEARETCDSWLASLRFTSPQACLASGARTLDGACGGRIRDGL